jgi:hypothetical protein
MMGWALLSSTTHCVWADTGIDASTAIVDLRFRYANIESDAFTRSANANTLRILLGYRWVFAQNWTADIEGSDTVALFGSRYNDSANGKTQFPSESDPPSKQVSAAWVGYDDGIIAARVGRQYINLDNQRFFTSGLWRQTPQSFDALIASWKMDFSGTTLQYIYLDKALRSVGHDYPDPLQRQWDLQANLLHLDQLLPIGKLNAYDYLVENDTQAKYSWRTAGLRWSGKQVFSDYQLIWAAEFAQQSSWRNSPLHYTADYHLVEVGFGNAVINVKLGNEVLGSKGKIGFSSPYGSNHGFNGWASEFKNTPATGLDDRNIGAFGQITKVIGWSVFWHDFYAAYGRRHYGAETNIALTYSVSKQLSAELDYADYRCDGYLLGERKAWLSLEYKY